jgi:predicted transcriptional regulator
MPTVAGLAVLKLTLINAQGVILHRNFMHFEIISSEQLPKKQVFSTAVSAFVNSSWSAKQWNILDDKKANGAGSGFFEYEIPIPKDLKLANVQNAYFLVELSAKTLFEKDKNDNFNRDQDYMKGDVVYSSSNPNAYPMTDATLFSSDVSIYLNGVKATTVTLPDDPADHRGVLSWHHQLMDRKLREAGSYGYMIKVPVSKSVLKTTVKTGHLAIKLQTNGSGGIAVYGKQFGRYPFDPSLVVVLK